MAAFAAWMIVYVSSVARDPRDGTWRPALDSHEDPDFREAYVEALRGEWFGACDQGATLVVIRGPMATAALRRGNGARAFRLRPEAIHLDGRLRYAAESAAGNEAGRCFLTIDETLTGLAAGWHAHEVTEPCDMKRVDAGGAGDHQEMISRMRAVLARQFPDPWDSR